MSRRHNCRSALARSRRIGQSGAVHDPDLPMPESRSIGFPPPQVEGMPWRDFVCPGCGRGVRLRGSLNVTVEWERRADLRYLGFVVAPGFSSFEYEVEFETDSGVRTGTGRSEMVDPATLPPAHAAMIKEAAARGIGQHRTNVHECAFGGTANDRAVLAPEPPSRESSMARSFRDDAAITADLGDGRVVHDCSTRSCFAVEAVKRVSCCCLARSQGCAPSGGRTGLFLLWGSARHSSQQRCEDQALGNDAGRDDPVDRGGVTDFHTCRVLPGDDRPVGAP